MSTITLPQARIALAWADTGGGTKVPCSIDVEWMKALTAIVDRVGGVNGWSIDELRTAPEDPGAASVAALGADLDAVRLASEVAELRAQVAELSKADIESRLAEIAALTAELAKTDIEGQIAQLREQVAYMGGMKRKRVVAGVVSMSGTNTATFTVSPAVSSLTMCDLRYLGSVSASGTGSTDIPASIELTNTTTITARRNGATGGVDVYFQLTEYTQ